MSELSEASESLKSRFIKHWFENNVTPEQIGHLVFVYKDTHGLPMETSMEVIFEQIDRDIEEAWLNTIQEGLKHYEMLKSAVR